MTLRDCTEAQATEILAILNEAIVHSTALYDYQPRPVESMGPWFAEKRTGNYPVIGAFLPAGTLAGFATYGPFRARPAYKYSIEHSVYVEKSHRCQGIGTELLRALIERATAQGYHMMIGGIDAANRGSVRFHEQLGFTPCGTIREAGFKFGHWLDLEFHQLILPTPAHRSTVDR